MGEITRWRRGAPGMVLPRREIRPSEVIWRIGTPMFCVDVLSEEPLDVVFTGFNAAQAAATGIDPTDLIGLRPQEALPARSAENVMANYRRCLASGGPVEYEEGYEAPGGVERWYHTTLGPWTDASGRVVAIVGSAVEITAQHARAEEDADTIARLSRLSDEVRTFASMAAHDVRSPLTTVEGLMEVVVAELDAGRVGDAVDMLNACGDLAREARGQMDDLLRHADALGTHETPASETDLGRMGRDVAAVVDAQGKLSMSWPQDVVEADAVTLQLILRNLVSNAARHCRRRVAVTIEPRADGLCAFTVRDDGPGFDRDPFAEVDQVRRYETARGFGLSAARHLVESRGGAIGLVLGAPGGAVRFTIPCRVLDA